MYDEATGLCTPALKRRAIIEGPSGTLFRLDALRIYVRL
jgi:hypothetical protein